MIVLNDNNRTNCCAKIDRTLASASVLFTSLLLSLPSNSLDFVYSLFYEGEYSDNVDRVSNNALKEFTSRIGTGVGFNSESVHYQYQGGYDFTYVDYLYNSSDDEFQISGNLFSSFEMIEDILSWQVDHTQAYVITDRSDPDAPDNRERSSTLSIGPTLNVRINPTGVDTLTINTRYTTTDFEDTDEADSERRTIIITWRHLVSRLTSFSLNAEYSDVTFDAETNDYEYFRYSAGVNRVLKQGDFSFDVGLNKTKPEENDQLNDDTQEEDSIFINSLLQNQWGRHSLNLIARRELVDNSFDLNSADTNSNDTELEAGATIEPTEDRNFTIQDIIDRQSINIAYVYAFNLDSLSLQLSWYDEDYQTEPADETSTQLEGAYNLVTSNRSAWTFTASTEITDFKEDNTVDEETTYDIGVSYAYTYPLTSELDLTLGIDYERRFSYGSQSPRYYEETSTALSLRYTPL